MSKCQLIVITGPIGGGKSFTAIAVAGLFRAEGIAAAVIDLDVIYLMARPDFTPKGWGEARCGAGVLANQFLVDSHEVVIVEGGDFNTEEEFSELERCVTQTKNHLRITLLVRHDEVRRNVIADPKRDYTPTVQPGRPYRRYVQALPYLTANTTVVETAGLSLTEVAGRVFCLAKSAQL